MLGANETHTFSRFVVSLESYDPYTKSTSRGRTDKIGTLMPFDEASTYGDALNTIVEPQEQHTPEVKMLWSAPKHFGCVSIQAKVYHPSSGWIENEADLNQIVCSTDNDSNDSNNDNSEDYFSDDNDYFGSNDFHDEF